MLFFPGSRTSDVSAEDDNGVRPRIDDKNNFRDYRNNINKMNRGEMVVLPLSNKLFRNRRYCEDCYGGGGVMIRP